MLLESALPGFVRLFAEPAPVGSPTATAPGINPWGWLGGASQDIYQWTGLYVLSLLPAASTFETVSKALPKGMYVRPDLVSQGCYPVVLLFGAIQNAHNREHPFFGMNYFEMFSAIPGVYLKTPDPRSPGFTGPFIYPYRGYLNHLIPTVLGWLAGYPKHWKRITADRQSLASVNDNFVIYPLLGGTNPILTANFTTSADYYSLKQFSRFPEIARLLSPNIIHGGMFGKHVMSAFDLDFDNSLAWNLAEVNVQINEPDVFPGLVGSHSWKGLQNEFYGAVRLLIPWRLLPQNDDKFNAVPWPPANLPV